MQPACQGKTFICALSRPQFRGERGRGKAEPQKVDSDLGRVASCLCHNRDQVVLATNQNATSPQRQQGTLASAAGWWKTSSTVCASVSRSVNAESGRQLRVDLRHRFLLRVRSVKDGTVRCGFGREVLCTQRAKGEVGRNVAAGDAETSPICCSVRGGMARNRCQGTKDSAAGRPSALPPIPAPIHHSIPRLD